MTKLSWSQVRLGWNVRRSYYYICFGRLIIWSIIINCLFLRLSLILFQNTLICFRKILFIFHYPIYCIWRLYNIPGCGNFHRLRFIFTLFENPTYWRFGYILVPVLSQVFVYGVVYFWICSIYIYLYLLLSFYMKKGIISTLLDYLPGRLRRASFHLPQEGCVCV
jgi:hypothetical protein